MSETSPLGLRNDTTYDHFNRPVTETTPSGAETRNAYNNWGHRTAATENYVNGVANDDGSGTDDLITVFTYDEFGRETRVDLDDGLIDQVAITAYDLLDNVTSETVYAAGGTSGPRTTTHYFETASGISRAEATATRLPVAPGGSPAPSCPNGGGLYCNERTTIDISGRAVRVVDAYGKAAVTFHDLAGHPVIQVANYVDGVFNAGAPDTDLVSRTQHDILGRPERVYDVAGRYTLSRFDRLGRPTEVIRVRSTGTFDGSTKTVYTPGGRVDRVSRLAATWATDADRAWTAFEYDAAGDLVTSIDHHDTSGDFRRSLSTFEDRRTTGWSAASTGSFVSGGASIGTDSDHHTTAPKSGRGRLRVTTGASGANSGAWLDLSGATFRAGRTYRLTADVIGWSGNTLRSFFGVDASGGSYAEATPLATSGAWQRISVDWTPSADVSSNVHFGIRKDTTGTIQFYLDNVDVWDVTAPDWDIPTETVLDADGRTIVSVQPPGAPGEPPMPTATAYDADGRPVAVSLGAAIGYPAKVRGTAGLIGYWPLDEASGTTASDRHGSNDLAWSAEPTTIVAGAVDEARTGVALPGSAYAQDGSPAGLPLGASPRSVGFWYRGTSGAMQTVLSYGTASLRQSFGVAVNQGGAGRVGTWTSSDDGSVAVPEITDGAWHQVVVTYDGATTMTVFVDGTERGSYQLAGSLNTTLSAAGLLLGRDHHANANFVSGEIGEVALYNAALSEATVAAQFDVARPSSGSVRLTSRNAYDALGRTTDAWDATGTRTRFSHDRLGRPTATTAHYRNGTPSGATSDDDARSTFAHNAVGELVAYCPARAAFADGCKPTATDTASLAYRSGWHYTYNAMGTLVGQVPPVNATATPLNSMSWTYDAGGRLTTTCSFPGGGSCASTSGTVRHTDYTYDGVGRELTQRVYGSAGTGSLKLAWTRTYNPDGTLASLAFDGSGEGQGSDTLTYTYDSIGRIDQLKRGTTVLTDHAWTYDDTLSYRVDGTLGTVNFGYDWADRQTSVGASGVYSGSIATTWRHDGLLGTRSWPGGESATWSYDSAKRPTSVTYATAGTFTQAYDRDSNVVSEGRSLTGINGDAGANLQTFTYDALNRVAGSSGLTAGTSYTYDLDGNRLRSVEGSVTTDYAFDRAGQIVDQTIASVTTSFGYDALGNMVTAATPSSTQTTYAYDAANRLKTITPASGDAAAFGFDALGRFTTRTVGANTDTYAYVGVSETVYQIVTTGAAPQTVDAVIDSGGNRPVVRSGTTVGWLLPDLHGNLAAVENQAGTALTNALRYDAWGQTVAAYAAVGAGLPMPWKFQGRLDVSPDGRPLYDAGARFYDPGHGVFTQLDAVMGSVENPISMNRYLYAHANPATFIDPDGQFVFLALLAPLAVGFVVGAGTTAAVDYAMTGQVDPGNALVGGAIGTISGGTGGAVAAGTRAIASRVVGTTASRVTSVVAGGVAGGVADSVTTQTIEVANATRDGWSAQAAFASGATSGVASVVIPFVGGRVVSAVSNAGRRAGAAASSAAQRVVAAGQRRFDDLASRLENTALVSRAQVATASARGAWDEAARAATAWRRAAASRFEPASPRATAARPQPPNPHGRPGSPAHRRPIAAIEQRLERRGWQTVSGGSRPERAVMTSHGRRFPDLVMQRGGQRIAVQSGRSTVAGRPVARERGTLSLLRQSGRFSHVFYLRYDRLRGPQ